MKPLVYRNDGENHKANSFHIDYSCGSTIADCQLKGVWKLGYRRDAIKDETALCFGGATHAGLEHYYKNCQGYLSSDDEKNIYDEVLQTFQNYNLPPSDDYRTPEYSFTAVKEHANKYFAEDLVVDEVEEKVYIEISSIVINSKENWAVDENGDEWNPTQITIYLVGKIDIVGRLKDDYIIMDHKTTSIGGPKMFDQYETSWQMKLYCWAKSKQTGKNYNKALINALVCRRPTKNKAINIDLERKMITFTGALKQEAVDDLISTAINFLQTCAYKIDVRKNTNACVGKYGRCEYYDVCTLDPHQRVKYLMGSMFKDHTWNPLEEVKPVVRHDDVDLSLIGL